MLTVVQLSVRPVPNLPFPREHPHSHPTHFDDSSLSRSQTEPLGKPALPVLLFSRRAPTTSLNHWSYVWQVQEEEVSSSSKELR